MRNPKESQKCHSTVSLGHGSTLGILNRRAVVGGRPPKMALGGDIGLHAYGASAGNYVGRKNYFAATFLGLMIILSLIGDKTNSGL